MNYCFVILDIQILSIEHEDKKYRLTLYDGVSIQNLCVVLPTLNSKLENQEFTIGSIIRLKNFSFYIYDQLEKEYNP